MNNLETEVAFVDSESLGLDRPNHPIWDAAVIAATHYTRELVVTESWSAFIEITAADLAKASPDALRITRFYDRYYPTDEEGVLRLSRPAAAQIIARMTACRHFVACVPDFDAWHFDHLLRDSGYAPAWNYHLICAEVLVAARFGKRPPWRSDELAKLADVSVADRLRHTAFGDAIFAMGMYAAVYDLKIVDGRSGEPKPWPTAT